MNSFLAYSLAKRQRAIKTCQQTAKQKILRSLNPWKNKETTMGLQKMWKKIQDSGEAKQLYDAFLRADY
jgi:hypothetical protein